MLVFDAVGVDTFEHGEPEPLPEGSHRALQELYDVYQGIKPKNVQESWHDVRQALEEARSLFKFGYLGLRDLALAERLFGSCCERHPALRATPQARPGGARGPR